MPPGGFEPPTARSSAGRSPAELRRRAIVIIHAGGLRFNAGEYSMVVRVLIQPISWFSPELLWRVEDILANMFDGASFIVSSDVILPPLTSFNWLRRQYYSPLILKYVYEKTYDIIMNEHIYVICLGDIDAYSDNLNFVFGEAAPSLNVACVYTRRLKIPGQTQYIPRDLYLDRIIKEIIHEWGHLLGLTHCTNKRCVMSFSNSVVDVDEKTPFFCEKCRNILLHRYGLVQRNILD